ncbi:MAG: hypothetical protein AAF222_15085, partial [Pseudomonadota bacterium]
MRVLQMIARGLASRMTFVLSRPSAKAVKAEPRENTRLRIEKNDPDRAERHAVAALVADLMLQDEWVELGDQIG